MNIKELKQFFTKSLSELYPSEEIQSFFNLLSEKHVGMSRIEIALHPDKEISEENLKVFKNTIQRLKNLEPIQYILGETAFFGLNFKVDKNVLIPRPETEELVAWVIKERREKREEKREQRKERREKREEKREKREVREESRGLFIANLKPKTILDIGTGSGCIAISLAHNLPNYKVSAIDISEGALKIAKQNASDNNVLINFQLVDILNFNQKPWNLVFKNSLFDTIVSNPPYVRELEKELMEPNVVKHEPALALFVEDNDPLLFYRKIAQFSQQFLKEKGTLFFEINEYLSKDVCEMLTVEGFINIEVKKDIFEKDRMVKCNKK